MNVEILDVLYIFDEVKSMRSFVEYEKKKIHSGNNIACVQHDYVRGIDVEERITLIEKPCSYTRIKQIKNNNNNNSTNHKFI